MASNKIFILWSLTSLFHGLHAVYDQERLNRILAYPVTFFDSPTTIGSIYGDPRPTIHNFNPGSELEALVSAGQQIRIDFTQGLDRLAFTHGASNFYVRVYNDQILSALRRQGGETPRPPLVISIIGEPQSGKTQTLRHIDRNLRLQWRQREWVLKVSINDLVTLNNDPIVLEHIIQHGVSQQFTQFFRNVLDINPSRVTFLLDGIDQVPHSQINNVLSIISEINGKGATVVTTSNTDLTRRLSQPIIGQLDIVTIPEMESREIKHFLLFSWENNRFVTAHSVHSSPASLFNRCRDYAKVTTKALERLSFPRTISAINTLATQLSYASDIFHLGMPIRSISLSDYLHYRDIDSTDLVRRANNMRLNTMHLYNHLMKVTNFHSQIYGAHAFNLIVGPHSDPLHSEYLEEAKHQVQFSRLTASTTYKYMTLENGVPTGFIRPEYRAFFAATYILKYMAESSDPTTEGLAGIKEVLENPRHTQVVEFINSGIHDVEYDTVVRDNLLKAAVSSDGSLNHKVIDNLIRNGFDNLCTGIFERLDQEALKSYIHGTTELATNSEYVFGLLSQSNPGPDAPAMTGTRREIMLQMKMLKSTSVLDTSPYFGPDEDLHKLAKIVAKQDSTRLFSMLMTKIPTATFTSEFYSELLFHVVDATGISALKLSYLSSLGADGRNVLVDGRTLTHVAMKWQGKNVLQYVIEKLNAPTSDRPDNQGRTPTMNLLETNLYPYYSPKGFFEKSLYWAQNRDAVPLGLPPVHQLLRFEPLLGDIPPEHRRMLFNDKTISPPNAITHPQLRIIPPSDNALSAIRDFRMYSVFKKCLLERNPGGLVGPGSSGKDYVILAEVLAHYRGLDTLSPSENDAYHETIRTLCTRELRPEHPIPARHVTQTIVSNLITESERQVVLGTITDYIQPLTEPKSRAALYQILVRRTNDWVAPNLYGIETMVLRSRADLHPALIRDIRPARNTEHSRRTGQSPDALDMGYDSCVSDRKRRSTFQCFFSRKDVVEIAEGHEVRDLRRIIINVDVFLEKIFIAEAQEPAKAKQLIQLAKRVQMGRVNEKVVVGKHQTLFKEILEHGSFHEYFESQRFHEGMHEFEHTSGKQNALVKRFKMLPSQKRIFASAVVAVPFVKSIFETILSCAATNSAGNSECQVGFLMLALNAGAMVANSNAHKLASIKVNMKVDKLLSMIPAGYHNARAELEVLRRQWLNSAARRVDIRFVAFGLVLEIPNLYKNIKVLVDCAKPESTCTSKDIGVSVIMTGGVASSLGAQIGIVIARTRVMTAGWIGLALVAAQSIALAINDLIYYHNTYSTNMDEEFRTFWRSLVMVQPPADVRNLINRTERINALDKHMNRYLSGSSENVIAYALGIGKIENKRFSATEGYINMAENSSSHTARLSRVQPTKRDNVTHLCLSKKVPDADFEVQSETHSDAVYECDNAMVIADAARWKNRNKDKSFVVYDLGAIDKGKVIGSSLVNNMFILTRSTAHLRVTGGPSKLINLYVVQTPSFHGTIVFGSTSRQEILDLSHILQTVPLYFFWHHELMGTVLYSYNKYDLFNMVVENRKALNLHVIGRTNKPDFFQCRDPTTLFTRQRHPISVDGGGGGESAWDSVIGCQFTRLRPFTHILGMGADAINIVQIILDASTMNPTRKVYSTIQPSQSVMGLRFSNRPILLNTYRVIYEPTKKNLTWEFYYEDSTMMVLDIIPYYQAAFSGSNGSDAVDATDVEAVTCLFFDDYLNVTIQPIIRLAEGQVHPVLVQQFHVVGTIQSSEIEHVHSSYEHLATFLGTNTSIHLTNNKTKETFIFGSEQSDEILITEDTVLAYGGNGSDIYIVDSETAEYIWINNEAPDRVVDILIMSCLSLQATRKEFSGPVLNTSLYDVQLSCSLAESSRDTNVVLQQYLCDDDFAHLIIQSNALSYVILPQHWISPNDEEIRLGLFVAYDLVKSHDTVVILEPADTYVVFNISDKHRGLVAYKSGHDVNLAIKTEAGMTGLTQILLKNFFTNSYKFTVSSGWRNNLIFITDDNIGEKNMPKVLDALHVVQLIKSTEEDTEDESDFVYKQYLVDARKKGNIDIDHNNEAVPKRDRRFGAIKVENGQPGSFHAKWTHNDTLTLCTYELSVCINIKNWCDSVERRINRMEFHNSFSRPIISVRYMDQLACKSQSHDNEDELINRLNDKLYKAQRRLELSATYNKSDVSRLLQCIGYLYADNVTLSITYRLFGFTDIVHKSQFIRQNCLPLFTFDNLFGLSQDATNEMLEKSIEIYRLGDEDWTQDQRDIDFLLKGMKQVSKDDWHAFLSRVYNNARKENEYHANFGFLTSIDKTINTFSHCQATP